MGLAALQPRCLCVSLQRESDIEEEKWSCTHTHTDIYGGWKEAQQATLSVKLKGHLRGRRPGAVRVLGRFFQDP